MIFYCLFFFFFFFGGSFFYSLVLQTSNVYVGVYGQGQAGTNWFQISLAGMGSFSNFSVSFYFSLSFLFGIMICVLFLFLLSSKVFCRKERSLVAPGSKPRPLICTPSTLLPTLLNCKSHTKPDMVISTCISVLDLFLLLPSTATPTRLDRIWPASRLPAPLLENTFTWSMLSMLVTTRLSLPQRRHSSALATVFRDANQCLLVSSRSCKRRC
jgi:hypothetical protein